MLSLLEKHYDLTHYTLTPGPSGNGGGSTMIAKPTQGPSYIFKQLPHSHQKLPIVASFLHECSTRGIDWAPHIMLTKEHNLWLTDGEIDIMGMECIDGATTFDYSTQDHIELFVKLHMFSYISPIIPHEQFGFPHSCETLIGLLESKKEEIADESWEFVSGLFAEWKKYFARCEALSKEVQLLIDPQSFVLTHGDMDGNIIRNAKGKLIIIDRDELKYSLPERDLSLMSDHELGHKFYQQIRPTYTPNPTIILFFLYQRFCADLGHFVEKIINHPKANNHHRRNTGLQGRLMTSIQQYENGQS